VRAHPPTGWPRSDPGEALKRMDDNQPSRPTDRPRSLRRLEAEFLRPHRRALLFALGGMLVQSLLLLPVPLAQGWALDRLIAIGAPGAGRDGVLTAVLLAFGLTAGCHLARGGLAYAVGSAMTRVSLDVVRQLTDAMHRKLQRLPVAYFDREPTGQVMSRITSDVGTLLIFLGSGSLQLASDLILAAGIAAALVWLSWPLALVCLATLPLFAVNQHVFAGRARRLSAAARRRLDAVYRLLSEKVSAVRVVRAFAQEGREVAAFAGRLDAHRATGRAEVRAATWQVAVAAGLSGLGLAAVLTGGAVLVRVGRLTAGDVIAFAALVGLLYNPLVRLTQFQRMWAATRVAIDRMMGVLDEPEGPADRPAPALLAGPRGALVVRHVSFGYGPGAPPVLDGVSLTIPAGATVAVLGPSGAGKSTLLALLARLYDPDRGSIRLAGADLRSVPATGLRRAVALVPQQAVLFEGTIRSNLLYAAPDARPGEVRRVLEAVELAGLVDGLPLGLETPVGERGVTLSGGQRQRLTLARALLADPAVLLLDDCTSALDAETEDRVWAHLEGLAPGQTRVIVSHKLSTARRADWVVVLDQGRVAEQGRPNRLLAAGGRYADLTRLAGGPPVKQGGLHDGPGWPSAQRTGLGPVACMPE